MKTYKPGDIIQFKPEWCNPNEINVDFIVVEDNGDRVLYRLKECNMSLVPIECSPKQYIK
jgi:hypothetical protein